MLMVLGLARGQSLAARLARYAVLAALFYVIVQVIWHLTLGEYVNGIALGSLYGILAVGILLIYKTTRVVNFAAAAIGAVPAILALMLDVERHWPYLLVAPIALLGGPIVGVVVDLVVMRKLSRSPRLIVTVATIGVAQSLGAVAFFIPFWLSNNSLTISVVPTPWQHVAIHNGQGQPVLTGDQIAALVATLVLTTALALFLRFTRLGIALRAVSENGDRASLLGIPTRLVGTVAWALAGLIGATAIFVQAPLIGVPRDATLGFDTLLFALTAAVVAKMERVGLALGAGMGAGVLVFASVASNGGPDIAWAVMLVIVLAALLVSQRGKISRAFDTGVETWQAIRQFRQVPTELRADPVVRTAKGTVGAATVAGALALGLFVSTPNLPYLVELPIFGIVAVSLVVLTGWAGQISLGQFGFVAAGALVGGGLAANHNIDFFAAIGLGIATGAVAALIVGIPALRINGLFLAVATLAFAYTMEYYVLNPNYPIGAHLLPTGFTAHLARPVLWQRVDLSSNRSFYFVCLVLLGLTMLVALSLRRFRSGRVLIGLRDNQRGAAVYGVSPVGSKLAAFAISGGMAGMAGVLLAYSEYNVIPGSYDPLFSVFIFLAVVIGGVTSVPGAVAGAVALRAGTLFIPQAAKNLSQNVVAILPLILTGPLLVTSVLQYPGGMAELAVGLRDRMLRRLAKYRGVLVPSLVADRAERRLGDRDAARGPATAGPAQATGAAAEAERAPALLECRGLEVAYSGVQVLFGVDLEVRRGEILALLGTNGAGKSTILRAVSGLVDPIGGSIHFDGEDITHAGPVRTAKAGIVHVPGGKAIFPTLTVGEHFRIGCWALEGEALEAASQRVDTVLALFPVLYKRWGELAGNLSGGEAQQLALGMAFVTRPKLLVIDELSLGLAPALVERLLSVVRELHEEGTTVLLVEQSVNLALLIAERAYFLEKGEVRFEGHTADLLERDDILRAVFLEGAATISQPEPTAPIPKQSKPEAEPEPQPEPVVASAEPAGEPAAEGEPVAETAGEPARVRPIPAAATLLGIEQVEDAPAGPRVALDVTGLTKRFGGVLAVDGVSFEVGEGQILGLIGPNGAGKTTVLDLVSGLLVPDAGTVRLNGVNITRWSPAHRASAGLGRSFQDARIFPSLTVAENLAIGLDRHVETRDHLASALCLPAVRESEGDVRYTVEGLIEMLKLQAFRDKFVSELSTGSRRVVELAMTMAHRPSVLVLDEPSSGIAQREVEALGPLLLRIREEAGCSMILIEHDMPLITSIADEIAALDLGRVIVRGSPHEVTTHPQVVASYLGERAARSSAASIGELLDAAATDELVGVTREGGQ